MDEKKVKHEMKVLLMTLIVCPIVTVLWVGGFPILVRVLFGMAY